MKLPRLLVLISVFVLVFVIIIRLEREISLNESELDQKLVASYKILEEMRYKANVDFQIQSWFSKLREFIFKKGGEVFQEKHEPSFLKYNLPTHTLAIAEASAKGKMLNFCNLAGKMNPDLARTFIDLAQDYKSKFSDFMVQAGKAEVLNKCNRLLRDFIGVKSANMRMIVLRSARASIFNDRNSSVWFYWDNFNTSGGKSIFIFSKLSVAGLENLYPFKSFLKTFQQHGIVCSYFNENKKTFHFKKGGSIELPLEDLEIVAREGSQLTRQNRSSKAGQIKKVFLKKHIALIGREIGSDHLRPVVFVKIPVSRKYSIAKAECVGIMAFISILVLLIVNVSVYGRGPKMNVGRVLIIAMVFAISMPVLMGFSVFRLILYESFEKERLKIERDVHQSLIGIDKSFLMVQSNLQHRIERFLSKKEILEKIRAEEKIRLTDENASQSIVLELARLAFAKIVKGYEQVPEKYRTINAMVVSGPNGFMRYFNKFRGNKVFSNETIGTLEAIYSLVVLFRGIILSYYPKEAFDPEFYDFYTKKSFSKIEEIKIGEIKARFKSSLGAERYHEILNSIGMINTFRTSFGTAMFSTIPVAYNGKFRYFFAWSWDEFAVCPVFLRRAYDQRSKADYEMIKNENKSFLSWFDPLTYIRRKPIVFMAYDGFRFDSFTNSKDGVPEILSNLLKASSRTKQLLKTETSGKDAAIYQVYPGKNITVYLSGAQQDITHLKKIETLRSSMFLAGLVIFFLFSVFASKNISSSFTSPLQHLLWGLKKVEENDYSVKLKDTREDEFGSISRAFNQMTRRLREKDTLGMFVSDSVKRLAASPELLKMACEGSEEEVTILFANLEGMTKLVLEESEAKIQKILEFSLEQFFNRAKEFGGEIDKVIGEKILIVFPNKYLTREKAAEAAVGLAKAVRKDFERQNDVKPVFGINMGRVISGIIGATSIRMDLTVIGDPVNVAARLCALANSDNLPIVVSGPIKEALGKDFEVEKIDIAKVKGKRQEVEVFKIKV
ncbi:MAG: hypothetical protein Kow0029_09130 [Candidatus Rifleibacteriota bacterium]